LPPPLAHGPEPLHRPTDLLEQFPTGAVTEWLGHSAAVAAKHHARVPDHLYDRAAGGGAESGAMVV
jgi:hypothetical protein